MGIWMMMLLEGLAVMEGNYVHRDIKPQNIVMNEQDGIPYLVFIDFGLVLRNNAWATPYGTPFYLPPEHRLSNNMNQVTNKVDVWATGASLFEVFCGGRLGERVMTVYYHMNWQVALSQGVDYDHLCGLDGW